MDDNGEITNSRAESPAESFLSHLTNWIDNHLRPIRYVSYGVAAIGIIILGRTARVTQKFCKVSDIPERFISSHVRLQGRVVAVTEDGLLHVDHSPILVSRFSKQSRDQRGMLPVHLAAVDVWEPGVTWMNEHLLHQQLWFRMLAVTEAEQLSCVVHWQKNWYRRSLCINQHLVKEGLASFQFEPSLQNDVLYQSLSQSLTSAEIRAEKKGKGVWKRAPFTERLSSSLSDKIQQAKLRMKQRLKNIADSVVPSRFRKKMKNS